MVKAEGIKNAGRTEETAAGMIWSEENLSDGPKAAAVAAKDLARPSALRAPLEVAFTWAALIAIEVAYLRYPRPWTMAIAFVLVASRQYALLILMHDAFHSLLHRNRRVNDFIGSWLIGAPCGSSYWKSRSNHLEHHRRLGERTDPDLFLYCSGPPREKRGVAAFARHFLSLMLGEQILFTHMGSASERQAPLRERIGRIVPILLPVVLVQFAILALFWLAGAWLNYLLLWVLPLLTLAVLFNGLRAFCDHANLSDDPGAARDRLITYFSHPLERFFLAPFHMNFHAEHHLFPYVPHYNLPKVRSRLWESDEQRAAIQWRRGYLGFVREFLRARG